MSIERARECLENLAFAEASAALAATAAGAGQEAELLALQIEHKVLSQPFVYALAPMLDDASATDVSQTQVSLQAVRAAVSRLAGRVQAIGEWLTTALGSAPDFLPAVEVLEPFADGTLRLPPTEAPASEAMWLLRQEWTRLNWILVCVGARTLELPGALAAPPEPLDYLETLLSARFNLLLDQSEGRTLQLDDELDRGMAETRWGGATGALLRELPAEPAARWLEETGCAIAAVRWLRGEQGSPFDEPE